jgi:hypothetical protein
MIRIISKYYSGNQIKNNEVAWGMGHVTWGMWHGKCCMGHGAWGTEHGA